MFSIIEKDNKFKKSTHFTKLKAGGKFSIYALGIYLVATFTVGCLGLMIGFPLLTFPLAMLISNPVVWILMGIVLTVTYKIIETLFHLAKDYISKKRAPEGKKSEEKSPEQEQPKKNRERPKTPDRDSGVITSEVDKNSFLYQTNKEKNYDYKLTTTDIRDIAKSSYGWIADKDRKGLKNTSGEVYFACPNNLTSSLEKELQEYKSKVEQGDNNLIFTSILNLNENHWVTLVVAYSEQGQKFRAYYRDSFGNALPSKISSVLQKILGIDSRNVKISKTKQQTDTHNCGIFALKNARTITDMLKSGEPFDEIDKKLSYTPKLEELEKNRIEFAKALEKNEQNIRNCRNSYSPSIDSGWGSEEFNEDLQTLVHQTNRKDYTYWLQQHDIAHIARIKYGYSEGATNGVFFCILGNLESLNERLREYKNKAERENSKRIFTSVINLGGNHWVTLVVAYDSNNKQFRAYYCDSFSANLPSPGSKRNSIGLANEIKDKLLVPLTDQASKLNAQGKKEMGKDVQKTAQTCRDKKNELVNVPINTDNMVSALEEILGIGSDNIKSSPAKQQNDSCNCGIFALENAHRITQMFSKGKSFDEIDKKLSEYKFDLNGKRREFTEVLMKDEGWRKDLEDGLLCDLPQRAQTFLALTQNAQDCNTISLQLKELPLTLCLSK